MITVKEASRIVEKNLPQRRTGELPLIELNGKTLAADIRALEPSPPFTNSAMDGFAVRWQDVAAASADNPVALTVVGESQAGLPYPSAIAAGQAVRISTGAMLCAGADTIVAVEDAQLKDDRLILHKVPVRGQHVRTQGEEFSRGTVLFRRGTQITPRHMALLAAQGITSAAVFLPPRAAVVVTGSELVPYGETPGAGQIRDSNGVMLQCALESRGVQVLSRQHVGDDYHRTVAVLKDAARNSDLILFSGGVSVGPHDHVKPAAAECGFRTLFWKVSQKPGKPLFFARRKETLFFGLPGNPVSAYMCFCYYVLPVIGYLCGNPFARKTLPAVAGEKIENRLGRAQLMRVEFEKSGEKSGPPRVVPLRRQGSHMLTSLSEADGFILMEEHTVIEKGDLMEVYPFG